MDPGCARLGPLTALAIVLSAGCGSARHDDDGIPAVPGDGDRGGPGAGAAAGRAGDAADGGDAGDGDADAAQDPPQMAGERLFPDAEQRLGYYGQAIYGRSVAIEGDTIATGDEGGCVLLFAREAQGWARRSPLCSEAAAQGPLWIALDAGTLAVSIPAANDGGGRLLLYARDGDAFTQRAQLEGATDGELAFGPALSLDGDRLAVGGARRRVVVLARDADGDWHAETTLQGEAGDAFGASVALEGDWLAVGAAAPPFGAPGSVQLFQRGAAGWASAYVFEGAEPDPWLGGAMALQDGQLLLGATLFHVEAAGLRQARYLFDDGGGNLGRSPVALGARLAVVGREIFPREGSDGVPLAMLPLIHAVDVSGTTVVTGFDGYREGEPSFQGGPELRVLELADLIDP